MVGWWLNGVGLYGWLVEKCGLVEEVGSRTGTLIVSLFPPPPRTVSNGFWHKMFSFPPTKHKN